MERVDEGNPMPQRDDKRRGACKLCAETKRGGRVAWKDRVKGSYDQKHGELWRALSSMVRGNIELRFQQMFEWRLSKSPNSVQISQAYRRIEDEEGWISAVDGNLKRHYHNWKRRVPRSVTHETITL